MPHPDERPFCPEPFRQLIVAGNFAAQLCCRIPTPVGDLGSEDLGSVWNSRRSIAIRQSIHDGSFRFCDRDICPFLQGERLPRRSDIDDPFFRDVIEHDRVRLDRLFTQLIVSYDRSCNLACRSCRPEPFVSSGERLAEVRRVQERVVGRDLENLRDLEKLFVSGDGDAFSSPVYRDLLLRMRSQDFPKLSIRIMSNGLRFDRVMWDRLAGIRARIRETSISVDAATAETYARVRPPGSFDTLIHNLEFISGLRHDGDLAGFSLAFVVSRANFQEMPAFVELGRRLRCDGVTFMRMINPGHIPQSSFVDHPSHPEHGRFLEVLRDPSLTEGFVNIDAFSDLLLDLGVRTRDAEAARTDAPDVFAS